MEVTICEHLGIPEDAIVSVRLGTVRRQVPLREATAQPFRFPTALESCCDPVKIEVLQQLGSTRLVLQSDREKYRVPLAEGGMALGISVRCAAGEGNNDEGSYKSDVGLLKFKEAATSAQEYLEGHGLLRYVQALLHVVIKERPDDPYSFMTQQLMAAEREGPAAPPLLASALAPMEEPLAVAAPSAPAAPAAPLESDTGVAEAPQLAAPAGASVVPPAESTPAPEALSATMQQGVAMVAEPDVARLARARSSVREALERGALGGGLWRALEAARERLQGQQVEAAQEELRNLLESSARNGQLASAQQALREQCHAAAPQPAGAEASLEQAPEDPERMKAEILRLSEQVGQLMQELHAMKAQQGA